MPTIALWVGFNLFVLFMLFLDLHVFHKVLHIVKPKEALFWSSIWVALALLFSFIVYFTHGSEATLNFIAGYLIELSLSVDNLFVFLLIFNYFAVPKQYTHKVLFWGIFGALIMRVIFIFAGIALIQQFSWIVYIFGAFLVFTGIKFALDKGEEAHPERNPVLLLVQKIIPVTKTYDNGNFFVKQANRYVATPLFLVLIAVETTDILFAFDSVPAILAITTDPFIVYTSNVFAILGLRSMFFALSGLMDLFHYLQYGLAALLIFIGTKMLLSHYIPIPTTLSLGVIIGILAISILASMLARKN